MEKKYVTLIFYSLCLTNTLSWPIHFHILLIYHHLHTAIPQVAAAGDDDGDNGDDGDGDVVPSAKKSKR